MADRLRLLRKTKIINYIIIHMLIPHTLLQPVDAAHIKWDIDYNTHTLLQPA